MTDLRFEHNGAEILLSADRSKAGWRIRTPGGALYEVLVTTLMDSEVTLIAAPVSPDGSRGPERILTLPAVRTGQAIAISWQGTAYAFQPAERGSPAARGDGDSGSV